MARGALLLELGIFAHRFNLLVILIFDHTRVCTGSCFIVDLSVEELADVTLPRILAGLLAKWVR